MLISGSESFKLLHLAAETGFGVGGWFFRAVFLMSFKFCFVVLSVSPFYLCVTAATIHIVRPSQMFLSLPLSHRWGRAGAFIEDTSPIIQSIPSHG